MSFIQSFINGLRLRCPFCYSGHLYQSYLRLNEECTECHESLQKADAGDGPAFFVMTLVGTISCIIMLWIELSYSPPLWVHLITQIMIIFGCTFGLLPFVKSILINLQYHYKATESHIKASHNNQNNQ